MVRDIRLASGLFQEPDQNIPDTFVRINSFYDFLLQKRGQLVRNMQERCFEINVFNPYFPSLNCINQPVDGHEPAESKAD